jgi:PPOX class probable F420-dependent enzyme
MSEQQLWGLVTGTHLGTLATIKKDGRPQLSDVLYAAGPYGGHDRVIRFSTQASLAKVHNVRRDPRVSLKVTGPGGWSYAVAEGTAEVSKPSTEPDDVTVEELIDIYRLAGESEHPDWDEFRQAMVADGRIVFRIHVERLYGLYR